VVVVSPDVTALAPALARVRHLFDLDAEPEAIAAHLGADPTVGPLVRRRPGLRVPGAWDGFELGVRAILGQQITVRAATELAGRLVAAFGAPLPAPSGPLTHLFPTPERLVGADVAALGMPRARAATIQALAAATLADPHLFDPHRAPERLQAIPGIGDWTAQYVAMRAGRDADAFPASDVGLQRALQAPARPTPRALAARAEAWRPWRAYAALHLWTRDQETP
jgi:AraC family transcriptional regulator of adaptative response / DNA-3-methyladenine glycosylase II